MSTHAMTYPNGVKAKCNKCSTCSKHANGLKFLHQNKIYADSVYKAYFDIRHKYFIVREIK